MGLKTATPLPYRRGRPAHLGAGEVGYIRKMKADEVSRVFRARKSIRAWTSGPCSAPTARPILLTDNRSSTFYKAAEDELRTVSLH